MFYLCIALWDKELWDAGADFCSVFVTLPYILWSQTEIASMYIIFSQRNMFLTKTCASFCSLSLIYLLHSTPTWSGQGWTVWILWFLHPAEKVCPSMHTHSLKYTHTSIRFNYRAWLNLSEPTHRSIGTPAAWPKQTVQPTLTPGGELWLMHGAKHVITFHTETMNCSLTYDETKRLFVSRTPHPKDCDHLHVNPWWPIAAHSWRSAALIG